MPADRLTSPTSNSLIALLAAERRPMTNAELAKALGCSPATAKCTTQELRNSGRAHVAGWDGQALKTMLGAGEDVPRPPPPQRTRPNSRDRPGEPIERDEVALARRAQLQIPPMRFASQFAQGANPWTQAPPPGYQPSMPA